jgi:hypothetical protein
MGDNLDSEAEETKDNSECCKYVFNSYQIGPPMLGHSWREEGKGRAAVLVSVLSLQ